MDVTIIQTSDAIFYYPMLVETSRTVRHFCIMNGIKYEQFVGVKRGTMPWHSAYNRIYMLKEMLDRGVAGWVLYMDADALIVDQDFDLRSYFTHRSHHGGIFSGYNTPELKYSINSGGFAINLSHPWGRALVLDYWRAVERIPDADFDAAIRWEHDVQEDQYMLFLLLENYVLNQRCDDAFLFEPNNGSFVNQGPFIAQQLRSKFPDFESRFEAIKRDVAIILEGRSDARGDKGSGIYVQAFHPRIHTGCGKKSLSMIESTGQAGTLVYGPYVDVPSGHVTIRVFGETRIRADERPTELTSDVVSEFGQTTWSNLAISLPQPCKGVLIEHRCELTRDVQSLEVRVIVGEGQEIYVHAIQIQRD